MSAAIVTRSLAKTFTTKTKEPGLAGSFRAVFNPQILEVRAVRGIDLHVDKGEVVAFIGPKLRCMMPNLVLLELR